MSLRSISYDTHITPFFLHIYLAKELSLFLREIPDVDQISVTLFWSDEEKEIQEWRMPETEKEKGRRRRKEKKSSEPKTESKSENEIKKIKKKRENSCCRLGRTFVNDMSVSVHVTSQSLAYGCGAQATVPSVVHLPPISLNHPRHITHKPPGLKPIWAPRTGRPSFGARGSLFGVHIRKFGVEFGIGMGWRWICKHFTLRILLKEIFFNFNTRDTMSLLCEDMLSNFKTIRNGTLRIAIKDPLHSFIIN